MRNITYDRQNLVCVCACVCACVRACMCVHGDIRVICSIVDQDLYTDLSYGWLKASSCTVLHLTS